MADKKAILLRIAPDLWDALNRWAADDLRSLNGQIEYLLRDAVRKRAGRAAQTTFAEVRAWVRELVAGLRAAGEDAWVGRLERALEQSEGPGETLEHVRAVVAELVQSGVELPVEAGVYARGLLRMLAARAE